MSIAEQIRSLPHSGYSPIACEEAARLAEYGEAKLREELDALRAKLARAREVVDELASGWADYKACQRNTTAPENTYQDWANLDAAHARMDKVAARAFLAETQ